MFKKTKVNIFINDRFIWGFFRENDFTYLFLFYFSERISFQEGSETAGESGILGEQSYTN